MIFGLLPALGASRPDPWLTLKDTVGAIAGAGRSLFLRKGLVAAQVALSFLLLFGAGLFVRSLQNLQGTETGVTDRQPGHVPGLARAQRLRRRRGPAHFYEQLLERLNSAPGITSAATAVVPILSGNEWDSSMGVEGYKFADGEDQQAFMNALSPGYFATMQIPMLEGRDFTRLDAAGRCARRHRQSQVRGALLPEAERDRQASRLWRRAEHEAEHRDRRRRRQLAVRRPARRRSSPGLRPAVGQGQHGVLRARAVGVGIGLQPSSATKCDSSMRRCRFTN